MRHFSNIINTLKKLYLKTLKININRREENIRKEVKYISKIKSRDRSLSVDEVNSFSIDDFFDSSSLADFLGNVLVEDSLFWVVHFRKLGGIDFWSLDDFDLSDFNVLDWINMGDFLGDFLFNDIRSEKFKDISSVGLGDFLGNDFVNFSSDGFLLR